jgi:hypothetical protein
MSRQTREEEGMNRKLKLVLACSAMSAAVSGGVAAAASSPTVSTSSATSITESSAVLRGTINPNGASTTYQFVWGLQKDVYGAASPGKSAGHGTTTRAFAFTATGLTPGTVYHYRLIASSRFGSASGADHAFKTAGHPPPQPATGGVTGLGPNTATLTGTVNPEGETTTYYFQYGTTTAYGAQTFAQVTPAGTAPVQVAYTLTGLSSFTTFHYRLLAQHGTRPPVPDGDLTFTTFASPRFVPRISARTSPRHDRLSPYVFTTRGAIRLPSRVPASLGCSGQVSVRYFFRGRNISFKLVPVQANCTFSSQAVFRHLPGRGKKRRVVNLRVRIFFRGNGYVAPIAARRETVALGRT